LQKEGEDYEETFTLVAYLDYDIYNNRDGFASTLDGCQNHFS